MKMVARFLVLAFQTGRRSALLSSVTRTASTALTATRAAAAAKSRILVPLPQKKIYPYSTAAAESAVDDDDVPRRFQELEELHPLLKANIVHDAMTEIQAKTYDSASQGLDVLGRARTGTGKTVGFLLPAMQRLLMEQPREKNASIRLLVLSPTRELAAQIESQVRVLAKKTGLKHQVVFGGSSKGMDIREFERNVPNVLVATPGRLKDHLQTTTVRGKNFSNLMKDLDVLVLDETDRLLDMGFRDDVETIMRYLPKDRQTLLFSATVPSSVKAVVKQTLKPGYVTVDCIRDTDPASHTNAQVEQRHVIVSSDKRMVSGPLDVLVKLVNDSKKSKEPLKMVVFFNTAHLVSYYVRLMQMARVDCKIFELHSKKQQGYRTRVSDEFRKAKEGILITTDVSARGVDYPGVTNVVQVGFAESRESYIHRLGRTGRAGQKGEGLLVLTDIERRFLETLKGLDIPVDHEMQALVDQKVSLVPGLPSILTDNDVQTYMSAAYKSLLGYYNGKLPKVGVMGVDKLVDFANKFAYNGGAKELPQFDRGTISKMGLSGARGLNVSTSSAMTREGGYRERSYGGGGGGGSYGGGGGGGGGGRSYGDFGGGGGGGGRSADRGSRSSGGRSSTKSRSDDDSDYDFGGGNRRIGGGGGGRFGKSGGTDGGKFAMGGAGSRGGRFGGSGSKDEDW